MSLRRTVAGVAWLALLAVAASPAPAQRKDADIQAEQRKLQQTQKKLTEERAKAAEARARESSLLLELEQIERRLSEKQREAARLETKIKKVQADLAVLRGDINRLEYDRGGQEQALARRLRALYKLQVQGGALPAILSASDPLAQATILRQLATLVALDARVIREYRESSDTLGKRRTKEEATQAELAELRALAQLEQAGVDHEAAKRRTLLAKVRDERAYHERAAGELAEAARRLEALIRDLGAKQRRLAKVPPPRGPSETPGVGFGSLRGRLPWPTEGRIVSAFGAQVHPRFGTRTFQNGVDIEATLGTEVAAVYAGEVVYTGWFKGYGNLIILDHGNEYYTLYAHVADIVVKEGDEVRQGQRIGTVGDTGSLAGSRLYFEVRYQGKPQDPGQWLRQRG